MRYKSAVSGRFSHIAATGFFISLAGSLPPGFITVALMQTTVAQGVTSALWFSLGVVLAELAFVYVALVAMSRFLANPNWMEPLRWCSLAVLLILTIYTALLVFSPVSPTGKSFGGPVFMAHWPFLAGILIRLLTPTMVGFWLGWNTTLFSLNLLSVHPRVYRDYILGIGGGTLVAHWGYIALSNVIEHYFLGIQQTINGLMLMALLVAIFGQARQMLPLRLRSS
jgi:threonine/homoserine/homoserine lactone efflux protein